MTETPKPKEQAEIPSDTRLLIDAVRKKAAETLRAAVIMTAIGGGAGAGAGEYVQGEYRERSGYRPADATAPAEPIEQNEPDAGIEATGDGGILDKAKKLYRRAKEAAAEKVESTADESKTVQEYRKFKSEYDRLKQGVLEAGDKVSFWGPFLLTFLATLMMANKARKAQRWLLAQRKKLIAEKKEELQTKRIGTLETESDQRKAEFSAKMNEIGVMEDELSDILSEGTGIKQQLDATLAGAQAQQAELDQVLTLIETREAELSATIIKNQDLQRQVEGMQAQIEKLREGAIPPETLEQLKQLLNLFPSA